jgi:hypothetical protein
VHNPEWTNFNKSDPGVTLIELFSFLTESLLYRCNQIPERNHKKFLSLLGVQLQPAASARGMVTFTNERGPLETFTLNAGLEVKAGQIPFRTKAGLDVLPVEARAYYKKKLESPSRQLVEYYKSLYVSFQGSVPDTASLDLYETTLLNPNAAGSVDLGQETVDGALWLALLKRDDDESTEEVQNAIGEKTISLGIVPVVESEDAERTLPPGGSASGQTTLISIDIPQIPSSGGLPDNPDERQPAYRNLSRASLPETPAVMEVTLPESAELKLWNNLEPLEDGAGQMPPAIEDSALNSRLLTWLRITWPKGAPAKVAWAGINVVEVEQRAHVAGEVLADGNGRPDQMATLAKKPVIPGSVVLTVTANESARWTEVDDLLAAGPEVPVTDLRLPPGLEFKTQTQLPSEVFLLNAEAGELRFGDGLRGKRPPSGAKLRADYDYGVGSAGNVAAAAINSAAALPAGIKVSNPVHTWGGADAETTQEGEKQISRYLHHRDRLVTAQDFETITLRTPGVDVGRVDVIPVYSPLLANSEPGDAPGVVTLMVIPKYDARRPDAPSPDQTFLNAICDYLDPRRLVTTEIVLRGPTYRSVWVSAGINLVAGKDTATVREAVEAEIREFLAPLRASEDPDSSKQSFADMPKGWPLRKSASAREILAVVSRVEGVASVNDVFIAKGTDASTDVIPMQGLELPRLEGVSVTVGEPASLDELRGQTSAPSDASNKTIVPVPVIPEEC